MYRLGVTGPSMHSLQAHTDQPRYPTLGPKTDLQRKKIMQDWLPEHNELKLEINNRGNFRKFKNPWKLSKIFPNTQ